MEIKTALNKIKIQTTAFELKIEDGNHKNSFNKT